MHRNFLLILALPCVLMSVSFAIGTASAAASASEVSWRRVSFADLDLTKSQGAATLFTRIRTAAHEVCRPKIESLIFSMTVQSERCISLAMDRAVADVNAPLLTVYYLAKSGRTPLLAQK